MNTDMEHILCDENYCSYVKHMLQMRDILHFLANNNTFMVHEGKQIDTKIVFFTFKLWIKLNNCIFIGTKKKLNWKILLVFIVLLLPAISLFAVMLLKLTFSFWNVKNAWIMFSDSVLFSIAWVIQQKIIEFCFTARISYLIDNLNAFNSSFQ